MDDLTTYYELQNLEEIIETVRYHMAQFCVNGHMVLMPSGSIAITNFTDKKFVDDKVVGRGLYLTGSLFNHSCDPNMIRKLVYIYYQINVLHYVFCSWYGNNRMMVLVDRCAVKSGDELCISYGTVLITHILHY